MQEDFLELERDANQERLADLLAEYDFKLTNRGDGHVEWIGTHRTHHKRTIATRFDGDISGQFVIAGGGDIMVIDGYADDNY